MAEPRILDGAPPEIGADVFIGKVMPTIRQASRTMDEEDLAGVYEGVMVALYGSLCLDFGAAAGADLFRVLSDKLMRTRPWERLQ